MDQPDFLISLHFQFSLLDCRDDSQLESLTDEKTVPFQRRSQTAFSGSQEEMAINGRAALVGSGTFALRF